MSDEPSPITLRYRLRVEKQRHLGERTDPIVDVELTARYSNESAPITLVGSPHAVSEVRESLDRTQNSWGTTLWMNPSTLRFEMERGWLASYHRAQLVDGAEIFERPRRPSPRFEYDPNRLVDIAAEMLTRIDAPSYEDNVSEGGLIPVLRSRSYEARESVKHAPLEEMIAIVATKRPAWNSADIRDALETLLVLGDDPMEDLERFKLRARARRAP